MRRGMLLVIGLGGCLILLLALGWKVAARRWQPSEKQPSNACAVAGTPLEILDIVSYEGPFWEDGSDREVVDIAAILLENRGDHFVKQGAVVLDRGADLYVFEFSWLPPHSRTLVMERSAKPYCPSADYRCYGWSELHDPAFSPVTATAEGMTVTLSNPTTEMLPSVTVRYKHYHADSSTYIGGITYSADAEALRPGESRSICPHHFSAQGSTIIYI